MFVGYVAVFAAAAVACFVSVGPLRRIEDSDTRRGLIALLVTAGAWSTAHVAFLLAPTPGLKYAFYLAGLAVGLAAVGPWLYFCSAYTGRSLHRHRTYRRVLVAAFLVILAVKLTNPLHGLYFTAEYATTPFPHLAVQNGLLHWIVMGLSYVLAGIGYFMLFELFTGIDTDTRPLVVLVGITGLPILLDIVGLASPQLLDITYEPLGVAVFALGFAFVFLDRFESIRVAGEHDEPVIVLNDEDEVREFNDPASALFPALDGGGAVGRPLWSLVPEVVDALDSDPPIVEVERAGGTRYYRVDENPFMARRARVGRVLTFTDITDRERYRRELERQNSRLEQFASMVSHDLRNPLNVAEGRIDLAREGRDDENLDAAAEALSRMGTLIEDLLALARQGQPIDDLEAVGLAEIAEGCWEVVDTASAELVVEGDLDFMADPDRLRQLLENLFRNAVEHGGEGVTIRVGPLDAGFYVEDDGPGIPEDGRDQVFESGYTTAQGGTGFGLAIVEEIADAHGWSIRVTEGAAGGARFEITGVSPA